MSKIMQTLRASELFKNINSINIAEFEAAKNITIDFSGINNIDLKAITALLNIQKVALLNKKTISITNATANVGQVLDVTGLNKTFLNVAANPYIKR